MSPEESNAATLALQTHLAEYAGLRDEINLLLGLQSTLLNYGILIIGGVATLLTVGTAIINQYTYLFLLTSIMESAICLALLETTMHVNDLSSYIVYGLTPRIERLLDQGMKYEYEVFRWGQVFVYRSPRLALKGLAKSGKFALPYLAAVFFIALFFDFRWRIARALTTLEIVLLIFAITLSAVILAGGIYNTLYIRGVFPDPFEPDQQAATRARPKKRSRQRDNTGTRASGDQ